MPQMARFKGGWAGQGGHARCYNQIMYSKKRNNLQLVAIFILLVVLAALLPPVRERLAWRLGELQTRIFYLINPPEEAVFLPQEELAGMVEATLRALQPTAAPPTATPSSAAAPRPTPTPLPERVLLEGFNYQDQHGLWNYCAPANLAMALSYWGWEGDRQTVGPALKPFDLDKNVMPYEMVDYIQSQTSLAVALRSGGTPELLKRLVAAGYPVLIEKGMTLPSLGWMGHFNVVNGYDEARQVFIVKDSYFSPPEHDLEFAIAYDKLLSEWRSFNYLFMVIYPPEQEAQVFDVLGEYADPQASEQIAARIASNETVNLSGVNLFFAWFNYGSSLRSQQDYFGAADAYDRAFLHYAALPKEQRPWRMMWYQTGPYFAYYYTGRYTDVVDLATITIDAAKEPYIEESYYWRARANAALGNPEEAVTDLRQSLEYHPGFPPSLELMRQLGISE